MRGAVDVDGGSSSNRAESNTKLIELISICLYLSFSFSFLSVFFITQQFSQLDLFSSLDLFWRDLFCCLLFLLFYLFFSFLNFTYYSSVNVAAATAAAAASVSLVRERRTQRSSICSNALQNNFSFFTLCFTTCFILNFVYIHIIFVYIFFLNYFLSLKLTLWSFQFPLLLYSG